MKDWKGNSIELGSTILYPGRYEMNEGIVEKIFLGRQAWSAGQRVPKLTVRITGSSNKWRDSVNEDRWYGNPTVTLERIERVLVIAPPKTT